MCLEELEALELDAFPRRDQIFPSRFRSRIGFAGGDQPEVGGAAVRADQETAPEMVQLELVWPAPRNEPPGSGVRLAARNGPGFRAVGLLAGEEHELPRTALVGRHPEGLVGFFVHQPVPLRRIAEPVQHHAVPAQRFRVEACVEHSVARAGPHEIRRGALDPVRQHFAGPGVQKAELVDSPSHRIGSEGQDLVVRRDLQGAEREIAVRGVPVCFARQLVPIEQEFFPAGSTTSPSGRAAAENRVFLAAPIPGEIDEGSVAHRRGRGIRDDPGLHLVEHGVP